MSKSHKLADKTIYQSIKFLHHYLKYDVNINIYKDLWFDNIGPKTSTEKCVKQYINAFKYLTENQSEGITSNLIRTCYYLLTNKRLSEGKINQILTKYYTKIEISAHINATLMHQVIVEMKLTDCIRYANLLSNYILMIKKNGMIIIYPSEIDKYKFALKHILQDWTIMYGFIVANELHVRNNNLNILKTPNSTTQYKNINDILLEKNRLKLEYRIKKMYLYGSSAKKLVHRSSDVDFLVVMDDEGLEFYEKQEIINECKKYLEGVIGTRVDIIDIKIALNYLCAIDIQESIRII